VSTLAVPVIADAPLLLWVGGSILVYTAAAHLLWWIRPTAGLRSFYGRALFQLGRFLYYLVVPYLVLGGWRPRFLAGRSQQGLLALEDLGLVGLSLQWPVTRWLEAAGTGLALGLLALLLLGVAWAGASRLSPTDRQGGALSFAAHPWWTVLVSSLYLEVHWAFYRGGLVVALDDLYAGVFMGFAAVCLEWLLNPFWRAAWQIASQASHVWLDAGLALTSALLFLLTRNLWVCLGVHWLLALVFWALGRRAEELLRGHSSLSGLPSSGLARRHSEKGGKGHETAP
jgi:hypothetical protein